MKKEYFLKERQVLNELKKIDGELKLTKEEARLKNRQASEIAKSLATQIQTAKMEADAKITTARIYATGQA